MNTFFSRVIVCLAAILTFASCDKDVNEVGANIVGENHFGFSSDVSSTILAYTQKTDEVDTSNLEFDQLGIFNSPTFGKTIASMATELTLEKYPLVLPAGYTQMVTSVIVNVPYRSRLISESGVKEGERVYALDSIIGDQSSKIKLSIFRSTKDIGGVFPSTSLNNRFFSNTLITTVGPRLNNSTETNQNDEFVFNARENRDFVKKIYSEPSLRLDLNNSFGTEILALGTTALSTEANFKSVFKGLFFKVEQSGANAGCMALMDFNNATVTIEYKEALGTAEPITKTLQLKAAGGNSVNVLEQINTSNYNTKLNNPNTTAGDDRLYIKGGNGSVAIINLFGNTNNVTFNRLTKKIEPRVDNDGNDTPDELDYLKAKGWIINEANLIFTIDQAAMGSAIEPNRILIYNANTKKPIADYIEDPTIDKRANYNKSIHDGIIQKVNGSGNKYRIRLTNYIRNLINKDSTNCRLAVAVCRNINLVTFSANKNASYLTNFQWSGLPVRDRLIHTANFFPDSSLTSPLGTVLYGSNVAAADNDKKLKLEIWYTKPN